MKSRKKKILAMKKCLHRIIKTKRIVLADGTIYNSTDYRERVNINDRFFLSLVRRLDAYIRKCNERGVMWSNAHRK